MSQLVSVAQFRTYTREVSTTSASSITAAIESATKEWEEWLDRWLVLDEYTEALIPDKRGRMYPKATPVIEASGYFVRNGGTEIIGGTPVFPAGYFPTDATDFEVEITYTGGFDHSTVPRTIAQNIMRSAYKSLHPDTSSPHGAKSVKLGDAAVTYDDPITPFETIDRTQTKEMRAWRRRHV